jgi:hypothetical protein
LKIEEMREQVRLAILSKALSDHQILRMIVELQAEAYMAIQGVEQNPNLTERTKARMVNDYEEFVLTLKEDRRAREDRLLQANNQKELSGSDEVTDLRTDR